MNWIPRGDFIQLGLGGVMLPVGSKSAAQELSAAHNSALRLLVDAVRECAKAFGEHAVPGSGAYILGEQCRKALQPYSTQKDGGKC